MVELGGGGEDEKKKAATLGQWGGDSEGGQKGGFLQQWSHVLHSLGAANAKVSPEPAKSKKLGELNKKYF